MEGRDKKRGTRKRPGETEKGKRNKRDVKDEGRGKKHEEEEKMEETNTVTKEERWKRRRRKGKECSRG